MSTIVTRAGKGSPLTNNELDANFVNLNTDKYQSGDSASFAQVAVDNILVNGNTISSTDTDGNIILNPNGSGTVDVSSSKITGLAAPTLSTDAATKAYVDTLVAAGIHFHTPVRVESPINLNATYNNGTAGVGATLTNAGTQAALVIDGVSVSVNDRVLVYQQTNQTQNGVYVVTDVGSGSTNWVLTRSTDTDEYAIDSPSGLSEGSTFFVQQGSTGAGESYTCNTTGTITFGTTNITFVQISSAQIYSAGTGLSLTGTQFAVSLVPIANGGTGQTTANAALNAFLPSQASNADKYLKTDGTNTAWANVPSPNNGTLSLSVSGTGLSGSASFTADQSGNSTFTVTSNATSANTSSTIVARDASGNFSAGTITAALSGNATTATTASATSAALSAGTGLSTDGTFNGSTARTFAVSYGTTAGTACQGNDSRLSDSRQATNTNTQLASLGVGTAPSGTAGEIRATNNITAYYSDERLKTKTGSIENALDKVKQIETMYYHANETAVALGYDASIIEVGVTAQSVERVMPQTVAPAPIDDKYLTVRYERLVPLLIEAIKELEAQVAELKGK
jgi:hypothetical protein